MPILPREPDCYPVDLLDQAESIESQWWLLYVRSRQEKAIIRTLQKMEIAHYAPMIRQRQRSPSGRMRTSFVPLFSTYVFLRGDSEARFEAVSTGSVMQAAPIHEVADLINDLRQIRDLIELGVPLTKESRLQAGEPVRVRNGTFAGYEGVVIRRENERRLLVSVRFMEQGVSVHLEDCQVESIA